MKRSHVAREILLASVSALAITAIASSASAQSVDYGALEQLYGEPVTTSATGKPQKVSEVPANMEIITQDDIRRSGADNLPDILQFVTGLDVRRYGFASATVAVRGMNQPWNPRLLVLLNGRQVYSDDYGYVPWQAIPVELDEIRQIEIVKGPNSALFGFNAVSGVINIITYDPLYDSVNVATARTGTQNLEEGSLVTTTHGLNGDVGVRASAGGYLAHEFFNQATETAEHGSPLLNPERGSLSAEGKWRVGNGVVFDISASDVSSSNTGWAATARLDDEFVRVNSFRTSLTGDTKYGTMSIDIYRNEMNFDAPSLPKLPTAVASVAVAVPTNWIDDVWVVRATDMLQVSEDHTVRVALEYRNNSLDSVQGIGAANSGTVNGTIGYVVYAGSGMWDWQINPKLSLTNALRVDHIELDRDGYTSNNGFTDAFYNGVSHTELSFNSGVVYQATDKDTIRLTAARGVQVPSLIDLGSNGSGNPNIVPSIVTNYEIDYDRAVDALLSVLRTGVFYQTDDDIINRLGGPKVQTPARLARIAANAGTASEFGIEIGIKGHTESGFRWNASYSLASVTQNLNLNLTGVPTSPLLLEAGTPEHNIIVGAGYSWRKFEFDGQLRWQSSYDDFNGSLANPIVKVSNFITSSARVGYKVTDNLTVALSGDQLAQNRLIVTGGPPIERRIIASATVRF